MNLSLSDLLWVTGVLVIAALFWRAHGIRERALAHTRLFCQQAGVLFLDESVGLSRLRLEKQADGKYRWVRLYHFEFTVTGGERCAGHTRVVSGMVQGVTLPPHPDIQPARARHTE